MTCSVNIMLSYTIYTVCIFDVHVTYMSFLLTITNCSNAFTQTKQVWVYYTCRDTAVNAVIQATGVRYCVVYGVWYIPVIPCLVKKELTVM